MSHEVGAAEKMAAANKERKILMTTTLLTCTTRSRRTRTYLTPQARPARPYQGTPTHVDLPGHTHLSHPPIRHTNLSEEGMSCLLVNFDTNFFSDTSQSNHSLNLPRRLTKYRDSKLVFKSWNANYDSQKLGCTDYS